MSNEIRHTLNPSDYQRSRNIAAGVLLALVVAGTSANVWNQKEVFSPTFALAFLTTICLLLGLNAVKIGG